MRADTSGTPTSQNAPPGVQSCGAVLTTSTVVRSAARPTERLLERRDVGDLFGDAAERLRMRHPVDRGIALPDILEHVPVRRTALVDLEAVDDGIPAVVAENDDELVAGENRAVQLGVEHEVRAVADEGDHLASGRAIRAPQAPAISYPIVE